MTMCANPFLAVETYTQTKVNMTMCANPFLAVGTYTQT